MVRNAYYEGYIVDKYNDRIERIEIYPPEPGEEDWGAAVWVDGNLADDFDGSMEDFIEHYGSQVLDFFPDFATGHVPEPRHISEVWPK